MKTLMQSAALAALACLILVGGVAQPGAQSDGRPRKPSNPMRLSEPRIAPLPESEWTEEQRELMEPKRRRDGSVMNIYRTIVRHPALYKPRTELGNYLLQNSTLPVREREILILRIAWLCRSEYEWGQHHRVGLRAGLTEQEITRIIEGPDAEGWDDFDRALVRSVDELFADTIISDATWAALSERYGTKQLVDLVYTIGKYNMTAMALNTFGVQLEEGVAGFPD